MRRFDEMPACSTNYPPLPEDVTCPKCGSDVEIWSDDYVSQCTCGYRVFSREDTVH